MSESQMSCDEYGANLAFLRFGIFFLFLFSALLGATFGSILGVASFNHERKIPLGLFIAIVVGMSFLVFCGGMARWIHISMDLPSRRSPHDYPDGITHGSTEWRKHVLHSRPDMKFSIRFGVWLIWIMHKLLHMGDMIFDSPVGPQTEGHVETLRPRGNRLAHLEPSGNTRNGNSPPGPEPAIKPIPNPAPVRTSIPASKLQPEPTPVFIPRPLTNIEKGRRALETAARVDATYGRQECLRRDSHDIDLRSGQKRPVLDNSTVRNASNRWWIRSEGEPRREHGLDGFGCEWRRQIVFLYTQRRGIGACF
ncbi:hypothetical protein CCHR01_03640 [Colletotrichum chrysophilum]|uniref:Uncharacterized protein n=1 Tax=Colletotrichum chrysophilum TaxID=1836956 RepID=A0AAD9AV01_9PEZI|nr:hypothetical protein CCHR01_03640 [Colletotrichum chrysophilum]